MNKIVFFGTPEFSVSALEKLKNAGFDIAAVVTAPDKPIGRKKTLTPPPVKQWAGKNDIKILQPAMLKDDTVFEQFSALKPDVCIVSAYGNIIPSRYLKIPKLGFVNIHPSLLPVYRGPTPIQSAILNGETRTGVTIMQVDAEIDHGPILAQETYDIPAGAYLPQVEKDLACLGAGLLVSILPEYVKASTPPRLGTTISACWPSVSFSDQSCESPRYGKVLAFTIREQEHDKATFTKKFTREDGHIDWSQSAAVIHNRIRALATEPGTWTMWQNAPLNILEASCALAEDVIPPVGMVVRHHDQIAVATSNGFLVLNTIQLSGSRPMQAVDFVNGKKDFIGSVLY